MKTEQEIWDRMLEAARTLKGFHEDGVTGQTGLRDEKAHGLDSMGRVELAVELERVFSVRLEDEEFDSLETLGDLVALVQRKVGSG